MTMPRELILAFILLAWYGAGGVFILLVKVRAAGSWKKWVAESRREGQLDLLPALSDAEIGWVLALAEVIAWLPQLLQDLFTENY